MGLALLGKGARKELPLWLLLAAVFSSDIVGAVLRLAGVSQALYHWSQSFSAAAVIAILLAVAFHAVRRDRVGSVIIALAAFSHVIADWVTGPVPTWPGGPMIGFGMVGTGWQDFTLELLVVVIGWLVYRHSLPRRARSSWALWAMVALLAAIQFVYTMRV